MRLSHSLLLLPPLLLVACGDPAADVTPEESATASPIEASAFTLCDVQSRLFNASCIGCHSEASLLSPPLLDSGNTFDAIVGVPAATASNLTYIVPGDPDASYLIAKIEGTHLNFENGNGSTMPLAGSVEADIIEGLRAWVQGGASESCESDGTPTATPTATAVPTPTPTAAPTPTPTDTPDGSWSPTDTPDDTQTPEPTEAPSGYTFTEVDALFAKSSSQGGCTGCHTGGGASDGLNLDDHEDMVNVPSKDIPSMDLIEPGDPANSYLFQKISGTHTDLDGGKGSKMPLGGSVSEEDLAGIEGWILAGAPNN